MPLDPPLTAAGAASPASARLRVLAPTRYAWTFNGPRYSRHSIERRDFLPLNWISKKIEGVTAFNPFPPKRFDIVHSFNRIPMGTTPFVICFESHLPRAYRLEKTAYFKHLCRTLAGRRCRGIIAISEHARTVFQAMHQSNPYRDDLLAKLRVRLPNIVIPDGGDPLEGDHHGNLTVTFVGNHFARKGGCVAVKLAELAHARKIPLTIEIVSSLEVGGSIWTDPSSKSFFDTYLALLRLPNVRWHGSLPNHEVNALLRRSHFSLLTTFGDTFGYSAIEAMANWTPVIATHQGALPEFIFHRQNGFVLDLPTSAVGEWVHSSSPNRATKQFEAMFADEVERLARQTLEEIETIAREPQKIHAMRHAARQTAIDMFDARPANAFWDDFYVRALDRHSNVATQTGG